MKFQQSYVIVEGEKKEKNWLYDVESGVDLLTGLRDCINYYKLDGSSCLQGCDI